MLDALARVRGTVPYAANLRLPGMLVAKVLRSTVPHGQILELDASKVEGMPGVAALVTGRDFDLPGGPALHYGVLIKDQPVVARDTVRFVGEPIVLVAAEDEAAANAALDSIDVRYAELPAVYDPVESMAQGAPVLHQAYPTNCFVHAKLRRGDVELGFEQADHVLEETYASPVAQQASLEPHVSIAQWDPGRLTVWTGTQSPYQVRRVLAEIFGLEQEQVRIIVPPLGGGYGGKGHVRIEAMTAALAWKAEGRPVKLVLSRAEEFVTVTKHSAVIKIKTGLKRDGSFTARQVTIHWGGGAYADASPGLVQAGVVRALGPYRFPAARVDSYGMYTNLPPAAAYRGAMSSQTTWAYESHMDSLARQLEMDPLELRSRNLLREGDQFATGERMHDVHFLECLEACAGGLAWQQPADKGSGSKRRGRGLAVMLKSTIAKSRSDCRLVLDDRGGLALFTSTVEMGQGAHTALAQIACDTLRVSLDNVRVVGPDTESTPFDTTTSASRSTEMMGRAVLKAAYSIRQKLIEAAVSVLEVAAGELDVEDGAVFVRQDPGQRVSYPALLQRHELREIEATGTHQTDLGLDPETGQGVASPHWHQGAGACEVEVDTETGKVEVLRYHAASYAGRVVNPALARLQNDGNVVFGLGPALLEEMLFDHGQLVNANLSDYLLPAFGEVPVELVSQALEVEGADPVGIGEMTLPPVAPAIANAVYDAVGVRIYDLPITPEKLLRALKKEDSVG